MRRKMLAVVLSASALAMTAAPATAAITVGLVRGGRRMSAEASRLSAPR